MKARHQPSKNPSKNEQILRLMALKSKLGRIGYAQVYKYEFNSNKELSQAQKYKLQNFWNYKITDLKLLNQFEWIADNLKTVPEIAKQPK